MTQKGIGRLRKSYFTLKAKVQRLTAEILSIKADNPDYRESQRYQRLKEEYQAALAELTETRKLYKEAQRNFSKDDEFNSFDKLIRNNYNRYGGRNL